MEIGIFGLPLSGKTTVFNALTGQHAALATFSAGMPPNVAVVKVPDDRLQRLAAIFHPRRIVPAEVRYVDVSGLTAGASRQDLASAQFVGNLRVVDALLQVVRLFADPSVPHPEGSIDPVRDIETVDLELAFADLAIMERRLARIEEALRLGRLRGAELEVAQREKALFERTMPQLEAGAPLRDLSLDAEEERLVRGYQFLTLKPMLVVLNIGEDQLADAERIAREIAAGMGHRQSEVVAICGKLEMEMAELGEEAEEFRREMGLGEAALDRVIRLSYSLLGLISFFTGGPEEVRAWTIHRGTPAVKAAGVVHSDMERGFIRGEVINWEKLVQAGSLAQARRLGILRLEGKDYVVQDGDLMHILFNV